VEALEAFLAFEANDQRRCLAGLFVNSLALEARRFNSQGLNCDRHGILKSRRGDPEKSLKISMISWSMPVLPLLGGDVFVHGLGL
jgi:hypothetical protein